MSQHGYPNLDLVNNSIRLLYSSLKPERIKSFENDLLPKQSPEGSWIDPVIAAQSLARVIAVHFRLAITTVVVTFRSGLPVPGRVELSDSSDFFIDIHGEHRNQRDCISAILAHEITHIFLRQHRIAFDSEFHNEVLTDTAASYLGCGILTLNGNTETKRRIGFNATETQSRHLGYITPDEFGYILAKRDLLLGHNSNRFLEPGLPLKSYQRGRYHLEQELGSRPFVRRQFPDPLLHQLRRILARNVTSPTKLVFSCPCCSQS